MQKEQQVAVNYDTTSYSYKKSMTNSLPSSMNSKKKNDVVQTSLSIISCIMGGGIVSVPFAYATIGFVRGIILQIIVAIVMYTSTKLQLGAQRILQCEPTYEGIAGASIGRISGVCLNALITVAILGILTLYMILFSNICISVFGGLVAQDSLFNQRWVYVVLLGIIEFPFALKKKLRELKFTSYALFIGVVSLVTMLIIQLFTKGSYKSRTEGTVLERPPLTFEQFFDSLNITLASYGFVICFFPIYNEMKERCKPQVDYSVAMALSFVFLAYTFMSALTINYYGELNVQPSIFENVKTDPGVFSVILRCMFIFIFMCNIPFVFFAGKTALLALIADFRKGPSQDEQPREAFTAVINSDVDDNFFQQLDEKIEVPKHSVFSYVTTCTVFLLIIVTLSILIDDLTLVFGLIAGIAECLSVFVLPSLIYIVALRKHKSTEIGSSIKVFLSALFCLAGLVYFAVSNYYNLRKFLK